MEEQGSFAEKIRLLRKYYDLSLSEMVMIIKLKSKGSLSTLENAKNPPSFETLVNIANAFAVKIDWLAGLVQEPFDAEIITAMEDELLNMKVSDNAEVKDIVPDSYLDREKRDSCYSLQARASILFYLHYLNYFIKKEPETLNINVDSVTQAELLEQGKFIKLRFRKPEDKYLYLIAVLTAILYRKPDI